MITSARRPRTAKRKAPVLRLISSVHKRLDPNGRDVTARMQRALDVARTGATAGAVIIEVDQQGHWSIDLAGRLRYDSDLLNVIVCRFMGACLLTQ
jgi:hypothetical protein